MTIDNCLEALLPLENNKKRKMRNRMKKKIIDYQTNKKQTIGLKIHYQLSNDKVPAESREFMNFINFRLI